MVLYRRVIHIAQLALLFIFFLFLDRLLPSSHPSPPPFSQDECQQLITLLRSFNREPLIAAFSIS